MKIIHAMIINDKLARKFAGKVVASMIRLGCDPKTMRHYEIPRLVFYGVLGGLKHCGGRLVDDVAAEEIKLWKQTCLTIGGL